MSYDVTVNCTGCGQTLVLPAADLTADFVCPRCGVTRAASAMVTPATPLRAVPAVSAGQPANRTMPLAEYVQQPLLPAVAPPVANMAVLGTASSSVSGAPAGAVIETREDAPPPKRAPTAVAISVVLLLGRAAWRLDAATHGKQLPILIGIGGAVWIARHFFPTAYVPGLFVYSSLLYLLLLARLWWIRDDDGIWSWQRFAERARAATVEYFRGFTTVAELSVASILDQLKVTFLAVGLAFLIVAPPLLALLKFAQSLMTTEGESGLSNLLELVEVLGGILVALGIFSAAAKWLRRRSPEAAAFTNAASFLQQGESSPFIVDVWEASRDIGRVPEPLRPFVTTLARWQPRGRKTEGEYEASLERFLMKTLPGTRISRQVDLASANGTPMGRIDMIIDKTLAIELKLRLRLATEVDRAVGQVSKYAAAWTNGPIVLLVCETKEGFSRAAYVDRLAELRRLGRAVYLVAAGRRLAGEA
ncbi:MAG: hypothetical protein ACOY0T_37605 [Myxococcota bacterium]